MRKIHEKIRYTILTLIDLLYPLFKRLMPLQTFRYAACGGINTFLDIALFSVGYNIVFKKQAVVLGSLTISPHIAALFMALSISLPTGFYLNRFVVFQESGLNRRSQLLRYLLVVAICIVLNYVFLKLFVDYLHWYPTLAKITTTALIVIFSYTSQTFYFFKARPKTN